jgi:hypothetical protein
MPRAIRCRFLEGLPFGRWRKILIPDRRLLSTVTRFSGSASHKQSAAQVRRQCSPVSADAISARLRGSETAHQSCVCMTERVEASAAWHLDTRHSPLVHLFSGRRALAGKTECAKNRSLFTRVRRRMNEGSTRRELCGKTQAE